MKKRKKIKVEIAPQVLTEQYDEIANHFIPKILGINDFFITDESSLYDFNFAITENGLERETKNDLEKIEKIYGVDVSDIEDLNLNEIFKRLKILSPMFKNL